MMKPRRNLIEWWSAVFFAILIDAAPASQPVLDRTMAAGQYHFASPAAGEWTAIKPDPAAESILFQNLKRDGVIQIELLPRDAQVDPGIAGSMAGAIIKELKRQRTMNHTVVVMPAKLEHDARFAIFIHEKYKVGDLTCDERYAYKSAGPRVLLMSVYSLSDDANITANIHKAGEAVLDSVKFDRKAFRKTPQNGTPRI